MVSYAGQLAGRVRATVAGTPGTGAFTIAGSPPGYVWPFNSGNNGFVYSYVAEDGANWEYGLGTLSGDGLVLSRTTILRSSVDYFNYGQAPTISFTSATVIKLTPHEWDLGSGGPNLLVRSDDNNYVLHSQIPPPTLSAKGGVKALNASGGLYVNGLATDGTLSTAYLNFPAPTVPGGVYSSAAVTNQYVTGVGTDGTVSRKQVAFSEISGAVSAAQLPFPTTTTLGGVKAKAAVASQFLRSIEADGSPTSGQPTFSDISSTIGAGQLGAGPWRELGAAEVGATSEIALLGVMTGYNEYEIVFTNVAPASANVVMHMQWHNGSEYVGGSNYTAMITETSSNGFVYTTSATGQLGFALSRRDGAAYIAAGGAGVSGHIRVSHIGATNLLHPINGFSSYFLASGIFEQATIGGVLNILSPITGVRLVPSTGGIAYGLLRVYGR